MSPVGCDVGPLDEFCMTGPHLELFHDSHAIPEQLLWCHRSWDPYERPQVSQQNICFFCVGRWEFCCGMRNISAGYCLKMSFIFPFSEESMNFVTVDEVGEEEEEEEKETVTTRTRGRPRKRTRPAPGNINTY